ncbi:hypothetical protein MKZ38_008817 [Zalerion maritima]|uniref:Uncharacterized protein n=1 Tax=Zalerion maritima TaxID=339359 RepID=A0AAD5WT83_9PEZI|nr:hypothetical protein MKZ38_008817 [Zalerion maritima]
MSSQQKPSSTNAVRTPSFLESPIFVRFSSHVQTTKAQERSLTYIIQAIKDVERQSELTYDTNQQDNGRWYISKLFYKLLLIFHHLKNEFKKQRPTNEEAAAVANCDALTWSVLATYDDGAVDSIVFHYKVMEALAVVEMHAVTLRAVLKEENVAVGYFGPFSPPPDLPAASNSAAIVGELDSGNKSAAFYRSATAVMSAPTPPKLPLPSAVKKKTPDGSPLSSKRNKKKVRWAE